MDNSWTLQSTGDLNCVNKLTVSNETHMLLSFAIFCKLEKNAHQTCKNSGNFFYCLY